MVYLFPDYNTAEYLPFIPIKDLHNSSNEFLSTEDDVASDAISIPVDFPFADTVQTRVYVSFQPPSHVLVSEL